ncbi:hypothetical protein PUN28_020402 [Cardiocondyla obscurior]|uniref:Uncharacterized protein n=1 Tax=Cardiocondyla obscurior TaxID=286306 RepID=A0AAW2E856_9HYME
MAINEKLNSGEYSLSIIRTRGSRAPFSFRSPRSEHPNRTDSWSKQTNGRNLLAERKLRLVRPARGVKRTSPPLSDLDPGSTVRLPRRKYPFAPLHKTGVERSPPRPSTLGYCNTEQVLHPPRCPNTAFAPRSKR